jgi:hypothetical protein
VVNKQVSRIYSLGALTLASARFRSDAVSGKIVRAQKSCGRTGSGTGSVRYIGFLAWRALFIFDFIFPTAWAPHVSRFWRGGSSVVVCSSLFSEWRFTYNSIPKNQWSGDSFTVLPGMSSSAKEVSVFPFPIGSTRRRSSMC